MSAQAETSGEKSKLSWGNRIKLGVGVVLGIAAVAYGGEQGFTMTQDAQAGKDQQEREDAAKDKACIRFERGSSIVRTTDAGRAIVRLAEMSPRQEEICGVPGILGAFDPYDNNKDYGIPLPKDAAIVKSSVEARLPSVGELNDSAKDHLDDASSGTSAFEAAERGGATVLGGVLAGGFFFIGAGGLALGADAISRRRQG